MGIQLDSPEEVIIFPPIDSIPDSPEDKPTPGPLLVCNLSHLSQKITLGLKPRFVQEENIGQLDLPELISGAATWSHFYNEKDKLSTDVPLRTIRLALR